MKYITILPIVVLICTLLNCTKAENLIADNKDEKTINKTMIAEEEKEIKIEYRWINSESGLKMRDGANLSGNTILIIPYAARVTLYEETGETLTIQGASGKWSKIQLQDSIGWVFGGFLSKEEPKINKMDLSAKEITGFTTFNKRLEYYMTKAYANIDFDSYQQIINSLGNPVKEEQKKVINRFNYEDQIITLTYDNRIYQVRILGYDKTNMVNPVIEKNCTNIIWEINTGIEMKYIKKLFGEPIRTDFISYNEKFGEHGDILNEIYYYNHPNEEIWLSVYFLLKDGIIVSIGWYWSST